MSTSSLSSTEIAFISIIASFVVVCLAIILARLCICFYQDRAPTLTFTYVIHTEPVKRSQQPLQTLRRNGDLLQIPPPHYQEAIELIEGQPVVQIMTPLHSPLHQPSTSQQPPSYSKLQRQVSQQSQASQASVKSRPSQVEIVEEYKADDVESKSPSRQSSASNSVNIQIHIESQQQQQQQQQQQYHSVPAAHSA